MMEQASREFVDDVVPLITMFHLLRYRRQRRWCVRPINRSREENGEGFLVEEMRLYDNETHFKYFRMSREKFDKLLHIVGPHITHQRNHRLPIVPLQRLAITLRYLCTGDSFQTIAISFRCGATTVSLIIYETCEVIWKILHQQFLPEICADLWKDNAKKFETLWNFPNCLGSIDGKHISLKAPRNSGSEYFNYKHFNSIVLLACVDADYCFTVVDIGAFGRESDGGVFSRSAFGRGIDQDRLQIPKSGNELPNTNITAPFIFVADDAFPLKENIMKPFSRSANLSYEQKVFNYRLSRARRVVENAFGILSSRWRVFRRPMEVLPSNAILVTKAAVVLHNFLRKTDSDDTNSRKTMYLPPGYVDYDDREGNVLPGDWRSEEEHCFQSLEHQGSNNYTDSASFKRQQFMKYFVSPQGALPWQDKVVNRGRQIMN